MPHVVRTATDEEWHEPEPPLTGAGLRVLPLVGARDSSVHLEIRLCELSADAVLPAHFHAFEESFYVLAGSATVSVGDAAYDVGPGDYGFAPVAVTHAWRGDGAGPVRWLEVRAPQPLTTAHSSGTVLANGHEFPTPAVPPSETDPRHRHVGHFRDDDMAPYGPLSMPGYHGPNIRNISVRMLVDRLLGAQHHTLFMVEFAQGATKGKAASEHYHPFEEIYFLLAGEAVGTLDGEQVRVRAGDVVWTGVNSTHGFVNEGTEPVRWLEVQSPTPPTSNAFFFPEDWSIPS